ncbi:hypothetical protein [uncultured Tateyamaria sp.]|uniref:hypothetical protein n=1 Tax=uncultured Tateyamaria sp. TaxID=455651 RepID=UPI00260EFDCC|nr:hypothetical protein [uncultured Tateyamaria sp.]
MSFQIRTFCSGLAIVLGLLLPTMQASADTAAITFFMFPDEEIRSSLRVVDDGEVISAVRPNRFSESDAVVYLLDSWQSVGSIQGAHIFGSALEYISQLESKTIAHVAEFDTSAENKIIFLFVNLEGFPAQVGWNCMAELVVWAVSGGYDSQPFSFETCSD